jgi:hypothetical protein
LAAQQRQDETQRTASTAEQDRRNAELVAGHDALAAEQAAFVAEQQRFRDELTALTAQHAEQTAEIERLQSELAEERKAFRDRREQIEQKLQARTEELETRWAELQTRQTEFDAWQESQEAGLAQRREALAGETSQPEEAQQTADEPAAQETAPVEEPQPDESRNSSPGRSTQLSSLALLTKMGLAVPSDDESDQPPPKSKVAPPPAAKVQPAAHAAGSSAGEEEDDIDAYMARLLDRVGGRSSAAGASTAASTPRTAAAPPVEAASPASEVSPAPAAPVEPKRPERGLAPRTLPPELSADLSAMREVANANARSAIKTHLHRTVSKALVKRMWACLVMLLVCAALIWRHFEGMPWMLEAAAVIGLLTVLMGTKQLYAMRKFRKVEAELDTERAAAGLATAQRAEQDRPSSAAESAVEEPHSAEASLPAEDSAAS